LPNGEFLNFRDTFDKTLKKFRGIDRFSLEFQASIAPSVSKPETIWEDISIYSDHKIKRVGIIVAFLHIHIVVSDFFRKSL